MMKYIKIVSFILVLIGIYWFAEDFNFSAVSNHRSQDNQELIVKNQRKVKKTNNNINKKITKSKYDQESEIFQRLQPPNDLLLKEVWLDEYGCAFIEDNACDYGFLNASSYEEALWMKNNGYPTISMIQLINDPKMQDKLNEMASKHYPAAMALMTIGAMQRGDFKEAAYLGLTTVAYSDNSKTYPHYLYGEALLADDKRPLALSRFYVAGLLGDNQATDRAISVSPNIFAADGALENAHTYLRRVFGETVPYNPRPIESDG